MLEGSRGVANSAEKAGHETLPAPHVGGEMQAIAVERPVEGDPIAELIRGGQHREALTACARTHHTILGRLCMALLGSQADADEAVQETLLRAHRSMPTYRAEGTVKAWLCGIARHVCAHVLETRKRGANLGDELAVVPGDGASRDAFEVRRRARAVRGALDQL